MQKLSKFKWVVISFFAILIAGCTLPQEEEIVVSEQASAVVMVPPAGMRSNFQKLMDNVIVVEKNPSSVVYEYHDVRVDQVSVLAAMYCQDNGNRNAYLEKIMLYKNNNRRATFYCSRK